VCIREDAGEALTGVRARQFSTLPARGSGCDSPESTYHFGMKAHVDMDAASGLVHSVVGTAANESDVSQARALLHGHEDHGFGDAGYTGVEKRVEMQRKSVKW